MTASSTAPAAWQHTEGDKYRFMAQYEKHFSVEEARGWLPELRECFARVRTLYEELSELQGDYAKVRAVIRANGNAPKETGFEPRVRELQEIVRKIISAGIEIKDVTRGLIDFPHWRDGEEVFLCWESSEDDLSYWHRIEDGFAGRTLL